ncbi:hypothetical protein [Poseidonocella sp. HB161398]|uniref:hypothetical protein n=1 Tax=Poseidonocella sp. HB161398 TaxID=2320855 RepID=UPI001486CDF7|nr:hypothetical protein [Poseidonocella sp. HB161398]
MKTLSAALAALLPLPALAHGAEAAHLHPHGGLVAVLAVAAAAGVLLLRRRS